MNAQKIIDECPIRTGRETAEVKWYAQELTSFIQNKSLSHYVPEDKGMKVSKTFTSLPLIKLTEYTKHKINNPKQVWIEDMLE